MHQHVRHDAFGEGTDSGLRRIGRFQKELMKGDPEYVRPNILLDVAGHAWSEAQRI